MGAKPRTSESLVEIAELDTVYAHGDFSQEDYAVERVHSQASLTLPALPGAHFDANFEKLLPAVDEENPALEAVFGVAKPGYRLLPGMTALVSLGKSERGLRVPAIALIGPIEDRVQVFVVEDTVARPREIQVGPYAGRFRSGQVGARRG